jgi:hypothetical protein
MNAEDKRTVGFVALVLGIGMVFAIGGFVVGYESGYNEAVEVCKEKLDRMYR